ncbi:MAG: stage 0 sporulation family protein [Candidatus Cryptobacteroides sp.]
MNNNIDSENIRFDCYRGCAVTSDSETGAAECSYRVGCCKLADTNWLSGVRQEQYNNLFEVRFKNTRKGFYRNDSGQAIHIGDLVIVEASSGHDLGIVTLEGPVVGRQMKVKGVNPEDGQLKKIYRRAKPFDIAKWQEAIARENETMIQARKIAAELGLEMKIGDVEFQGDGTKAIFYYIADGRVDFRQLIKVYAEEFRIRIEMKQIGARQEAGLIGGLGVCGRELCCARYITNFQSISTSAARIQDLSLNPQKLAGQCGKLKCCLNYEVASYTDALSRIPKVTEPLEFEDGLAYLMKTDILQEIMYFSYEKGSLANLYPLSADEVREVIMMNRNGEKPESLKVEPVPDGPQFISAVGDDSITRFDKPKRNGGRNRNNRKRGAKDARNRQEDQKSLQGDQKPRSEESGPVPVRDEVKDSSGRHSGRGRRDRRRNPRKPNPENSQQD